MARACLAYFATLVLSASAWAADPAHKPTPATVTPTATFVQAAVVSNLFEVESSKLALDRSQSAAIKTFAQHMVDDHSAAGVKFIEAENVAKLPLPPPPFKLDAEHQAMLGELQAKQGGGFRQNLHRYAAKDPRRCSRAVQRLCGNRRRCGPQIGGG